MNPGQGVLITRPEPGASQTAARVAASGFLPIITPVLSIIPALGPINAPGRFAATVLTSRNAVSACPVGCFALPVFTVGSATAACARAAGFRRVIDADADAAALPGLIAAHVPPSGQTVLLPTGRNQGSALAAALRRMGYRVVRRVAYAAVPAAVLPAPAAAHLQAAEVGAVLFFSTETARVFAHLIRAAKLTATLCDVKAISISERSAMPLRGLPWRRISVAAKPNQDEMLVLLR